MLSCFFLNLLKLEPGQAIYLPANVPHAYLNGETLMVRPGHSLGDARDDRLHSATAPSAARTAHTILRVPEGA